MKTARVYFRTSGETGKSNRGFGLETQRREVRGYCKDNNIEIIKEYLDNGVSGELLEESHGLMDLLADLNGEDYIISKSSCRLLGRGDYRQVMVKRHLMKSGKEVVFTDNLDYNLYDQDPTNVLINSMLELLDRYEKMNVTLRLSKSRRNKVKKTGSKGSGRTPLGYKWETIDEERVVIVNEDTKPVVEFLYSSYDPTNKFSTLRGLEKQVMDKFGIKLTPQGIRSILTNPFYVGEVSHGDIVIDGSHLTFITKHRFNKVGRLMKSHRKS